MTRTLHVVTHRRWMADDLSLGVTRLAENGVDIVLRHSLGLDAPAIKPGDALWTPTEWAARLLHDPRVAAPPLHLADPGDRFLGGFDERLLGRRIRRMPLRVLPDLAPEEAFFKPANVKIEHLPARWWRRSDFLAAARDCGVTGDLMVHWTSTRLPLVEEFRVFVLGGVPVAISPYLQHDADGTSTTWHEDMTSTRIEDAGAFVARAIGAGSTGTGSRTVPRAFVLDVGYTGRAEIGTAGWVVIETNPAWSAAPYGCTATPEDAAAVVECLLAAATPRPTRWEWTPDRYLLDRVAAQRPLSRPGTATC